MIRAVLDTNIIVSALLQRLGPPAQVFLLALSRTIQLCVSGEIYAEYDEVIRRPRLNRSEQQIAAALHAIRERAFWTKPMARLQACTDPEDNKFLECAESARAHYLVTGNLKHYPQRWGSTRIVTARQFLEEIAAGND